MKKLIIPIILFLGISINAGAQEKSAKEKRGDKYTFNYSYDKAIEKYTHTKNLSVEGQRNLAESYRNLDSNVKCEETYAKLISSLEGVLPQDYFNYSMVLKTNGKYVESLKMMDKFQQLKPEDLRAKDYAANKNNFQGMLKDSGQYKITHLDANTAAEDFGPCYYQNKIVFASTRTNKFMARDDNWHRQPYLDMYVSEIEGGQLKAPVSFDKKLNGRMHDGPASFNKAGTLMAFTRNNYHDKTKDRVVELQIYFSNNKDGKWSDPEPCALNNPAYSVGHPSLTADGNTMYFTSDMPGGFGGADIYRSTKDQYGTWSKPENLGDKVNTESDELFPFFEENTQILLFSSNGRFGLGGLDIFISEMSGKNKGRVYNAGSPLNTSFDDFAIIADSTMSKGYFSSNRIGGSGSDDIYSIDFLQPKAVNKKIEGIAKDNNGKPVPNTFITLLYDNDIIVDTFTTKDNGAYSFGVDTDRNFKLIGKKESYLDGNNVASTFGKEVIVKADLTLLKKEEPLAKKLKKNANLAEVLALNNIYFDLDKSNIRPDAQAELDKIVKIMNDYPTMVVELSSHADCRASIKYNQILSDKRAKKSVDYIKRRITNPSRITGKGHGKTDIDNVCPCEGEIASTCSEQEFQKDRNTEFLIKNEVLTSEK